MVSKKFNPFTPGIAVPPGIFSGRYPELLQIEKSLYQTINDRPENLLISGERAIGKTSIAKVAMWIAEGEIETFEKDKLNFLTISFVVKSKQTFEDVLLELILQMKSKLKTDIAKNNLVKTICDLWGELDEVSIASAVSFKKSMKKRGYSLESDEFCQFLESFWDTIKDQYDGIFFVIDEVDRISDFNGVASFLKALLEKLNFDGYNKIIFLLCGMPEIKEYLYKDHPSILRNFQPIELQAMPDDDARGVISKALGKTEISISEDALSFIVRMSGGYPHFLQEIGYSAFEVNQDNVINKSDVIVGLKGNTTYAGSIERLGRQYFHKMYHKDVKSDVYREILTIVARQKSEYVSRKTILSKFSKGKTILGTYLSNLVSRGLLCKDDTRKGYYSLPSHMFRVYIRITSKIS